MPCGVERSNRQHVLEPKSCVPAYDKHAVECATLGRRQAIEELGAQGQHSTSLVAGGGDNGGLRGRMGEANKAQGGRGCVEPNLRARERVAFGFGSGLR